MEGRSQHVIHEIGEVTVRCLEVLSRLRVQRGLHRLLDDLPMWIALAWQVTINGF